ncbi:MAG: glycosyltransferase [Alcaligenaceae bacterium]|nr:glycosyltransferase [Alcaligenaceae bacterium]
MQNDARATPARLTATATIKLPRLFLLGVGLVYIFAALFFRDPWKTDDVAGLATMLTALSGQGDHAMLLPQIGTLAYAQDGPLITWVGVFFIKVFAPIFEWFTSPLDAAIIASRLPNLLWFGLLTNSIWYGTYLLGRRPEAQPMQLPFGGEPNHKDYGRMIADAALLLIVATIGIIWPMHETSVVPALVAFNSLAFYAVARMLDHPLSGAITLGVALGAAFLTHGWVGALPMMLAAAVVFWPHTALWAEKKWLAVSALICATMILLWWIPAREFGSYWAGNYRSWTLDSLGWPQLDALARTGRDLPWFLWPTWPLAILALWRWRHWLRAPHILIPASFAGWALLIALLATAPSEPEYSLLAVPCAILAAFALPTLRRGVVNTLDWFAVMCFSLTAATVWLGWIALQTGWPDQISRNIARQTQGFTSHLYWPAIALAVAGTIAWIILVRWRLRTRPAGLWRGTALSAGGLITTWLLLATLWMPALDYARSYRDVSASLAQALKADRQPGECVRTLHLGVGQRASFMVFNGLQFSFDRQCTLVLQQTSPSRVRDGTAPYSTGATVLWQGKRGPDRHEMFRLLRLPPSS